MAGGTPGLWGEKDVMRNWFASAAVAALLAGGSLLVAPPADAQRGKQQQAQPKFKFSKEVQPLLAQAQQAQGAGDHAAALGFLQQADAIPTKNADDSYMIGMLRVNSGVSTENNELVEQGLEQALASGRVPEEEQGKFIRNLGSLALQRGDNAKAMQQFARYMEINPTDAGVMAEVAELARRGGDNRRAVELMRQAIAQQEKNTGEKADETWYRRALAISYDANLPAETAATSEALVRAYPNGTNWRDVLIIFRDGNKLDDQTNLDVMRLMRYTNALSGERDFFEYAETASMRGFPGEAKAVIDEGIKAGALQLSRPVVKELNTQVTGRITSDRAELPRSEKEARAEKNGRLALGTGDAYLGYSQYQKAAEMYRLAMEKGGVDTATANMRLGIALARGGDKAGAEAAFAAVTTPPRAQLARLWQIWLSQQG